MHRGPNPEKIEADGFKIEADGTSITFFRNVPRPGSRSLQTKEPYAFYAEVDKVIKEEGDSLAMETAAREAENLLSLLNRCRRLVLNWKTYKTYTPRQTEITLKTLEHTLDSLNPLTSRLRTAVENAEVEDDDDED